jgi:hypothetical protein
MQDPNGKKPIGNFSSNQVGRIVRIADRNPDRAYRVLDRMKKRKDIEGDTKIIKGSGIKYSLTKEEQDRTMAVGGLRQPKPLAEGSSQFKKVDLKSEAKPVTGSSRFKYVDLKSGPKKDN